MSPSIALLIWIILLVALLRLDPVRITRGSGALWLPVIAFFLIGSRLPAQWLGYSTSAGVEALTEGNALDRSVWLLLIGLSWVALKSRRLSWQEVLRANAALTALVAFGLASILWSDFPGVAFKRWIRDLTIYLVIIVTLSDTSGITAIRWVLRRVFFLLIPLSIVLIQYFPELSRHYDPWTGQPYFAGAGTSKNMLGVLCMVSGIFFVWDTLLIWPGRKESQHRRAILINLALLAMILWLLGKASSATSAVTLLIGSAVVVGARLGIVQRHANLLLTGIPVGLGIYLFLQFVLGIDLIAVIAQAVGRDPDLTGRTAIWEVLLRADINPLVGAGYESFWLGNRLRWVWERTVAVTQAHNGYLEMYLQLGLVGLGLLVWFLIASYLTIRVRFTRSPEAASFSLALWTILLFYNTTEAAFRPQFVWIVFLMGVVVVRNTKRVETAGGGEKLSPQAHQ